MQIKVAFAICLCLEIAEAAKLYSTILFGRCIDTNTAMISNFSTAVELQCAFSCTSTTSCYIYQLKVTSAVCSLFAYLSASYISLNETSLQPGACVIKMDTRPVIAPVSQYIFFSSSSVFVVPNGIISVNVLAVGGGAGALTGNGGAGGSGYVAYAAVSVLPGQTYTVTVGMGGMGAIGSSLPSSGGDSSFGTAVIAPGGSASNSANGGAGGCGGGSGTYSLTNVRSGNGGSAGSAGGSGTSSYVGGSGQGANFTAWFAFLKLNRFTAGSGSAGIMGNEPVRLGGAGAGGVLYNGNGPTSGYGACCLSSSSWCGPAGATGYGASGSAGCYDGGYSNGGSGANGFVYIEY